VFVPSAQRAHAYDAMAVKRGRLRTGHRGAFVGDRLASVHLGRGVVATLGILAGPVPRSRGMPSFPCSPRLDLRSEFCERGEFTGSIFHALIVPA
jgi:hypothetical protein